MSKFKTILILVMTILIMMTANVYAAEPQMSIAGDSEAKAGETKTLTVKLVSETGVGALGGKISHNENISNIAVSGKNNWSFEYNASNQKFVGQKASGTTNEDIMEITYTIASEATRKAVITFSDLNLTFIDFEETTIADMKKEVTITVDTPQQPETPEEPETPETPEEIDPPVEVSLASIEVTKAPSKVKYTEGEKFNKAGMEITAKYSDGTSKVITNYTYTPNGNLITNDKKIVISYIENGVTKTVEQSITVAKKATTNTNTTNNNTTNTTNTIKKDNTTVKNNTTTNNNNNNNNGQQQQNPVVIIGQSGKTDNTVANKELSKAGISNFVFYATMAIAVIGFICYIQYNKMKDIK